MCASTRLHFGASPNTFMRRLFRPTFGAPSVKPWLGEVGQSAFYRQIAQMDQKYTDEVAPRYNQVRCPTLILWGEQDRWIPIERGRQLQRAIPGALFRAIPQAGHLVQEDAPEAVVAALFGFLSDGG
jgi:pimeloyl-ACP methyl ester carboxylesterase